MGTLTTGKIAEVIFENFIETYEHQMMLMDLTDVFNHSPGDLQNAGNVVWRPVQQHRPVIEGWDITSQADQGLIEETYPSILGEPKNDVLTLRADDVRDSRFWERAGTQSARQQATELNSNLASLVANTGSMFYESNTASGYEFIAEGQALINERQTYKDGGCCFLLNDRDTLKFGSDLAGRQTVQGRPEETWTTGQIGANVAGFDVYTGSFLKNLAGGVSPDTTVNATVSEKPEGGTVDTATGMVANVDYRVGTITVVDSTGYNVGDKVSFTGVESVGLADKNATGQAMTFTIVAKPDATTVQVYPKPIALDDPALTVLEKAYANINTQIASGATMTRLNTQTTAKTNIFWCKDSIEIIAGDVPMQLMSEFGGMKVVSQQLKNGLTAYMLYDGDILKANFTYRLFVWYGLTNKNPAANGVATTAP